MVSTTTSKNIAITSYKRSRNSHVGIHLWESPTSTSSLLPSSTSISNGNNKNNIMKKQIMIVHIDDHSIFATNTLSNNTESSSSSSSVPTPTLKVGMKLVAVNGIPVTSTTTVNEIYHKLNNAVGYITLLVSTPHLPKDIISPIPHNSTTTSNTNDSITSPPPMYTNATYLEKSNVLSQERYNLIIPKLESINDDDNFDYTSSSSSSSSSTSSSFTSISSSSNNNNISARSKSINNVNDYDDEEDEDDDELNIYELEKRIRQIWNPILMG